jgi:hypothetical protein
MRGRSQPPSGPLPSVDVLEAGRVDARRLLRPPPLAAAHHHCLLTPPRAAATAARGTAVPLSRSTRDRLLRIDTLNRKALANQSKDPRRKRRGFSPTAPLLKEP